MKNNSAADSAESIRLNERLKLSALWASLMFCYIYGDIFYLFTPGHLEHMMEGQMGPFEVTQGVLLGVAILMAIPAVMVFLSLVLKRQVARWMNIVLGVLYTLVNFASTFSDRWLFFIFLGLVEIILTFLIIWYAWKWTGTEYQT
ncbi:MAG: hypothetical protein GF372_12435 [Candidatus Marinimicrobia bacterium]|nr:hypothetical protein [Candidatus Neomarinimicrobiota bacterium]